ncbi:hypothetical protein H310_03200 [Aphanomyces invadans]|uniref:Uncharacterized protein n=1 Tax=Aphanomyces invadans TaxID=157072 RepID=A0A024UGZ0_9STRA|nr:hypothetical protein H310_03200 [Aphanomyces invadans]ETW05435.1 hypothetical protein H310_03200 [Aphanomyces invadans]|eukprot:XP_008865212.1 hypothetical protein H310_03200 [Aphanomyces invadans]
MMNRMRVVVVDDHHHALEPIHQAIRRRVLPFANWTLVHFDAHPDLAFPRDVPAKSVFTPSQLYDVLDASEAGIASFVLPLSFAGHMESLIWVKPPWAQQMTLGDQAFAVGEHIDNGTLCVTSNHSYFVDEAMYAPESELTKKQTLQLTVCELHDSPASSVRPPLGPFVLDICLDYFTTLNPFLHEFEKACGVDDAQVLRHIYGGLQFKNIPPTLSHAQQLEHHRHHTSTMTGMMESQRWRHVDQTNFVASMAHLWRLYNDPSAMPHYFEQFYCMLHRYNADQIELVKWAAPCVDLPHHVNHDIQPMLDSMRAYLASSRERPRLITIATSQTDHYTPPDQCMGRPSSTLST